MNKISTLLILLISVTICNASTIPHKRIKNDMLIETNALDAVIFDVATNQLWSAITTIETPEPPELSWVKYDGTNVEIIATANYKNHEIATTNDIANVVANISQPDLSKYLFVGSTNVQQQVQGDVAFASRVDANYLNVGSYLDASYAKIAAHEYIGQYEYAGAYFPNGLWSDQPILSDVFSGFNGVPEFPQGLKSSNIILSDAFARYNYSQAYFPYGVESDGINFMQTIIGDTSHNPVDFPFGLSSGAPIVAYNYRGENNTPADFDYGIRAYELFGVGYIYPDPYDPVTKYKGYELANKNDIPDMSDVLRTNSPNARVSIKSLEVSEAIMNTNYVEFARVHVGNYISTLKGNGNGVGVINVGGLQLRSNNETGKKWDVQNADGNYYQIASLKDLEQYAQKTNLYWQYSVVNASGSGVILVALDSRVLIYLDCSLNNPPGVAIELNEIVGGVGEYGMIIVTGSTVPIIQYPAKTKYTGALPVYDANKMYYFSFKKIAGVLTIMSVQELQGI